MLITFWLSMLAAKCPPEMIAAPGFCIDRTEVTVAAYARCVARKQCKAVPSRSRGPGQTTEVAERLSVHCNVAGRGRDDHPMNCIDWQHADAYCRAQGKRLPSESEWELAARGHEGRKYPWGDDPPTSKRINACGAECKLTPMMEKLVPLRVYGDSDGWPTTAPVGKFPLGATPPGVLDMAGNVSEWTADLYQSGSPMRVTRGGGWYDADEQNLRPTRRGGLESDATDSTIGFRCVR